MEADRLAKNLVEQFAAPLDKQQKAVLQHKIQAALEVAFTAGIHKAASVASRCLEIGYISCIPGEIERLAIPQPETPLSFPSES